MLKIAVPNKGALSESTVELLKEAGYRCRRDGRELFARDPENEVDFYFLRPRDIAVYVAGGIVEAGITGRDLALDSQAGTAELLALNFGRASFRYAIPREKELTPDQFGGLRIATSYPHIVREDLKRREVSAKVVRLDGAVEISIQLGVADAIADVVQTGQTLEQAGLKVVGESILDSEAILVGRNPEVANDSEIARLIERIRGILVAREYVLVEYDVSRDLLQKACAITPGIEAPTVSPLANDAWVAVKAMAKKRQVHTIMDDLKALGAKGVLVTDIRACRL